jgi:hypothetical protein
MDPNEMPMLAIIDRLIAPIVSRLDQMDERQRQDTRLLHAKLDGVADVTHKVNQSESAAVLQSSRIDKLEDDQETTNTALAKMAGRNEVIVWVLGVIGGPITIALCLAGIAKLFNIDLGG